MNTHLLKIFGSGFSPHLPSAQSSSRINLCARKLARGFQRDWALLARIAPEFIGVKVFQECKI